MGIDIIRAGITSDKKELNVYLIYDNMKYEDIEQNINRFEIIKRGIDKYILAKPINNKRTYGIDESDLENIARELKEIKQISDGIKEVKFAGIEVRKETAKYIESSSQRRGDFFSRKINVDKDDYKNKILMTKIEEEFSEISNGTSSLKEGLNQAFKFEKSSSAKDRHEKAKSNGFRQKVKEKLGFGRNNEIVSNGFLEGREGNLKFRDGFHAGTYAKTAVNQAFKIGDNMSKEIKLTEYCRNGWTVYFDGKSIVEDKMVYHAFSDYVERG